MTTLLAWILGRTKLADEDLEVDRGRRRRESGDSAAAKNQPSQHSLVGWPGPQSHSQVPSRH